MNTIHQPLSTSAPIKLHPRFIPLLVRILATCKDFFHPPSSILYPLCLGLCRAVLPPRAHSSRAFLRLLGLVGLVSLIIPALGQPIKVACVGDSITEGANVDNPSVNAYPIVLGRLLGTNYQTFNFGVSGRTLLRKGDFPYWNETAFRNATNSGAKIVTIKLGTNDSKPYNWRYKDQFAHDLSDMIDVFANMPSHPRVYVCLPVPAYAVNYDIVPDVIKNEIIPIIKQVARQKGVMTVDLYTALSGRPDLFPNNIHPSTAEAALIARTLHAALLAPRCDAWLARRAPKAGNA